MYFKIKEYLIFVQNIRHQLLFYKFLLFFQLQTVTLPSSYNADQKVTNITLLQAAAAACRGSGDAGAYPLMWHVVVIGQEKSAGKLPDL